MKYYYDMQYKADGDESMAAQGWTKGRIMRRGPVAGMRLWTRRINPVQIVQQSAFDMSGLGAALEDSATVPHGPIEVEADGDSQEELTKLFADTMRVGGRRRRKSSRKRKTRKTKTRKSKTRKRKTRKATR